MDLVTETCERPLTFSLSIYKLCLQSPKPWLKHYTVISPYKTVYVRLCFFWLHTRANDSFEGAFFRQTRHGVVGSVSFLFTNV